MFIDSYNIPRLVDEYDSTSKENRLQYSSPQGWKVTIRPSKEIIIKKIPNQGKRKFD